MQRRGLAIVGAGLVFAALSATAQARPADVNVVNANPISVSGLLGIDPAHNTVEIGGQPIQVQPKPLAFFHAYEFIPTPGSAGGKSCVAFNIPAGSHVRIDSISVTTYSDASAVAYLRYLVKEGNSVSRILSQRIVTTAVGSDPVVNSRSALVPTGMQFAGGNVFDVQDGEAHSLSGCVQSSSGNSASGTFTVDGIQE